MMRMVFFQKDAKLPQEGNRKNATYSENHKSKDGEKFLRHIFLFIQFYLLFFWLFCIKWGNINVSWVIEFLICGYKVIVWFIKIRTIHNCLCDFNKTFLTNPHLILQISHAKTFKKKYSRCLYNDIIQKYS